MYETILNLHSYWAYLVLIVLLLAVINSFSGLFGKKEYSAKSFRVALFALIVSHIQFLIAIILYFVSPKFSWWAEGNVMGESMQRLYLVEHPLMNLIAIALITIGYSKHKKQLTSIAKYKTIAIFYTIALVFFLSRIPWDVWPR